MRIDVAKHDPGPKVGPADWHEGTQARKPPLWRRPLPWALAVLVPSTSLAVASVSAWLVPPYLGLMALILFSPGGRTGRSGLAGAVDGLEPCEPKKVTSEDASQKAETSGSGRADGPSEAPPGQVQVATKTSTMTATAAPPRSRRGGTDGGNGGSGKGRGRNKSKTKATPTAEPTWIQVAPGKFVRAEAGGPIPSPILPTTDPEGLGSVDSDDEGPCWGLELDEYADADADVADGLLLPRPDDLEPAEPQGLAPEGEAGLEASDNSSPTVADADPGRAFGPAPGFDDGEMPAASQADTVGEDWQGPVDDRASVDDSVDAGIPTAECDSLAQAIHDGPACDLALPEDRRAWDDRDDEDSATWDDGVGFDLGREDAAQDDGQSPDARAWGDRGLVTDSTEIWDNGNAPDALIEGGDEHGPEIPAADDDDRPGDHAEGDNGNAPDAPGKALLAGTESDDVDPYAAEVSPTWPSRMPAASRGWSPTGRVRARRARLDFASDVFPRRAFASRSGASRANRPPVAPGRTRPPRHPAASRGKVRRLGRPRRSCPTRAPPRRPRAFPVAIESGQFISGFRRKLMQPGRGA